MKMKMKILYNCLCVYVCIPGTKQLSMSTFRTIQTIYGTSSNMCNDRKNQVYTFEDNNLNALPCNYVSNVTEYTDIFFSYCLLQV